MEKTTSISSKHPIRLQGNMTHEHDEIVRDFLVEALESLDLLDRELIALEASPTDAQLLNSIFRRVHTVKGTCGFLEFSKLESITHVGESLLDSLRSGKRVVTPEVASALLQLVDATRSILSSVEATGGEGDTDYSELRARLSALNDGTAAPASATEEIVAEPMTVKETHEIEAQASVDAPAEAAAVPEVEAESTMVPEVENLAPVSASAEPSGEEDLLQAFDAACREYEANQEKSEEMPSETVVTPEVIVPVSTTPAVVEVPATVAVAAPEPVRPQTIEPAPVVHAQTPPLPSTPAPVASAPKSESPKPEANAAGDAGGISESSLRVDVALLDQLMNLVGELVLARNQILQFSKSEKDSSFLSASQRLNLITSELQEGVMRTRMQPIANIWNKFPRVVRDVARACGKDVRIEMEGKETDLDKTIIEAIKDPLTHIVRNSVDHGIETPECRIACGKNPEGRLLLRAYHEGGQVIIEIVDDGAGLNQDRIRAKAVERGLVTREKADRMTEAEVNRLIFLPGFSTAEAVTNISGRGVGMDVVKSNIEKIGGVVDVSSRFGSGSTVTIKIPLTLAIVPALMVSTGGQRFAIPQVSLLELVRVGGENILTQIEEIKGSLFYRLRGGLLPLIYLSNELRMPAIPVGDESDRALNIVVVRADERQFGLVVDCIHDTEEIVVKPLGKQLKTIDVFAGATILGDGKVALILDVLGLARRARVVIGHAKEKRAAELAQEQSDGAEKLSLLLVRVGERNRFAIPLGLVSRLEEFPASKLEWSGGRPVVQYRDGILPLVNLGSALGCGGAFNSELVQVVVHNDGEVIFGLVVDQVLDIVEERVVVDRRAARLGVLGAAIIQKRVTDLIDVPAIIETANFQRRGAEEQEAR